MSTEQIAKLAFTIKPLGCWILALLSASTNQTLEIHNRDLAIMCGVSDKTLKTTRDNLIAMGLIRYRCGGNWKPATYEVAR